MPEDQPLTITVTRYRVIVEGASCDLFHVHLDRNGSWDELLTEAQLQAFLRGMTARAGMMEGCYVPDDVAIPHEPTEILRPADAETF